MNQTSEAPLPSYKSPPVIEVLIGAQFQQPKGFTSAHLGLFWDKLKSDYPRISLAHPLPPLGHGTEAIVPQIEISSVPPMPRFFCEGEPSNWLVQLQDDRLIQNWRRITDDDEYPRFPAVKLKFDELISKFEEFCIEQNLERPDFTHFEVTYVNHILAGRGWDESTPIGQIFPDLDWRTANRFLPIPDSISWKAVFPLPNELGKLEISINKAYRRSDRFPVLLCQLSAKGRPTNGENTIEDWIFTAREWIVRAFADLTDENTQNTTWGRES